jgi:CDP-glucose 4,6-dehydratase
LGGKDVYSGSKGAAELVIRSYEHAFIQKDHAVRVAVGRAGNVIGGGDWARDRIVSDCMRAWSEGNPVEIRAPQSTRPWQHVLEPLSGYLTLGQAVAQNPGLHGEAFNFGPRSEQNRMVLELLGDLARHWGFAESDQSYRVSADIPFHESTLLKLNCDKAQFHLKWAPNLDYDETVRLVGEWYSAFYRARADMHALTQEQIADYERVGAERDLVWARSE